MAKILKFPIKEEIDTPISFIEECKEIITKENPSSILISIKCSDGNVMNGYYNLSFGEKQELIGHIQADVIDQMILANIGIRY